MSDSVATAGRAAARKPAMSVFERFLTFWVALCIIAGIALGQLMPGVFHVIGDATVAQVNLPVAVLVWLMIMPMLLKIDLAALARGRAALARHRHDRRRQLAGQAVLDGAAGLDLHRASVPALAAGRIRSSSYIAGLILLAAAPCTAMVFVWSNLVDGEPHFTLSQVALNDTIMVVAFAPIVGAAARPLLDHRALGHAVPVGRALHRRAGDRGAALAAALLATGRAGGAWRARCAARAAVAVRAAADARAAVRPAGRADHAPAARDRCCWRCRSSSRSISTPGWPTG